MAFGLRPYGRRLGLMLAGVALLAGCIPPATEPYPETAGYEHRQIDLSHHVHFGPANAEMGRERRLDLKTFLDQADPELDAELFVEASGPLGDYRADAVIKALRDFGREPAGRLFGTAKADGVTIMVRRHIAVPAACGWPNDGWPDPALLPAGCSTALNLAHMVEDQNDLYVGRDLPPAPAWAALDSLKRHQGGGVAKPSVPGVSNKVFTGAPAETPPPPSPRSQP